MNRYFVNTHNALEKRIVALYVKAAIGATGAPTLTGPGSKGIANISRLSAGKYQIQLQDRYVDLLDLHAMRIFATGAPGGGTVVVRSQAVNSTTPIIVIEFVDGTGTGVELNSGTTLQLKLELKATSV